jgi:hypothetical protein
MPSSGLFGAGRQLEDDALDDIVSFTEHLLELGIVGMADFMVQVCQAPFEDLQQYVLFLLSEIERFHGSFSFPSMENMAYPHKCKPQCKTAVSYRVSK